MERAPWAAHRTRLYTQNSTANDGHATKEYMVLFSGTGNPVAKIANHWVAYNVFRFLFNIVGDKMFALLSDGTEA